MYLAFAGEVLLVSALLAAIIVLALKPLKAQANMVITLALAFIAVTASFGAARYLGFTAVTEMHDSLSYLSRFIAMPLYAGLLLWGFSALPVALVLLLIMAGVSPLLGAPVLTTDVMIVLALLWLIRLTQAKAMLLLALVSLLLVPLSGLVADSQDLAMGLFHLLLAMHFAAIAIAVFKRDTKQAA